MSKKIDDSTDTFKGVSNSFQYIGEHVYAYTGSKSFDGNETTVFEATTGSGLINAKIQASVQHDTSDDVLVKLYLNNVQVMGDLITSAPTEVLFFDPFRLLIPPNTTVKITADNEGSTSTLPIYITITGKVNG
jgi:hypothetical protein